MTTLEQKRPYHDMRNFFLVVGSYFALSPVLTYLIGRSLFGYELVGQNIAFPALLLFIPGLVGYLFWMQRHHAADTVEERRVARKVTKYGQKESFIALMFGAIFWVCWRILMENYDFFPRESEYVFGIMFFISVCSFAHVFLVGGLGKNASR